MKKRLLSIVLALVMIFTLMPMHTIAAEQENSSTTGDGSAAETDGPLLTNNLRTYTHPTHLSEGSVSIYGCINKEIKHGLLAYEKGKAKTKGSVKLQSWYVDNNGYVHFKISGAKEGDTITLPVTVNSEFCGSASLKVVITIGYDRLTIISDTTVTYGSTLKLACAGTKTSGTVIYSISNGKEYATINGNILTPLKAGSVTITAVEVPAVGEESYSETVTITIEKATPSIKVSCSTLQRAGQTLSDAELKIGTTKIEGRLEWVLPGNTVVLPNTAYEWIFTPSDFDNYNSVTGTLTPYVVTDEDFVIGSGTTVRNNDGSYTTISYGEDDSRYELTEFADGHQRMVHKQLDGTIVTIEKWSDGMRTTTTEYADGSEQVISTLANSVTYSVTTDKYGRVNVQISLPKYLTDAAAKNGTVIELPIPEIPGSDNRADAPVIVFTLSTKTPLRVGIPINNPSAGTVAIFVAKNGAETVAKTSTTGKDKLYVTLSGSATVKVVDAGKNFKDVSQNDWFHSAADFVTSRGLFQGVDATTFAPRANMSRAMIVQVLHNLEGNPNYGIYPFYSDVVGTWYSVPASWAARCGYITGYPDGTFRGDENITREQLAVILYRYVGSPSINGFVNTPIYDYYDYADISIYAWTAMYWAVNSGVLYTDGSTHLSPGHDATRAEVAQTFRNLLEYLTG